MKFIIIGILTANVLAASCIYDAASSEPSPVAGLVAVAQTIAAPRWSGEVWIQPVEPSATTGR
jgi:uncharacterized lipoprotein YbaY